MKQNKSDQEFLARIKKKLNESADQLDELTVARLGAARRRAVAQAKPANSWHPADILVATHGSQGNYWVFGLLLMTILAAATVLLNQTAPTPFSPALI